VNFLKMDIGELNQALKYEAQKHIPFSLAEVNMDAVILKDDLADNKMLVLLAAIKKDALSQRLKVMDAAGLKAGLIDLDSIALVNVFNFNHPKGNSPAGESQNHKCIGLLNIGASLSNISIIDQGIPRFSRDIHIGGNNFTKKIMDVLNIDFKEAESIKINPAQGVDQRNKVKASVESVLGNLAAEIRTSFDYYESQNTSSVAKIFLSGGSSRFGALKEMLTTLLGIEVECWDPFAQIIKTDKIDTEKLAGQAFEFNVAVGLALR